MLPFFSKHHLQQRDILLWPCNLVLKPLITTHSISIESDPSSSTNLNILESHAPKVYACKPVSFLRKTSSIACRFLIYTMLSHSGGIKWNWFWFSMWRQKAKRKYLNLSQSTYLLGSMLHLNIFDASTFFPQGEPSHLCWPEKNLSNLFDQSPGGRCAWREALFLGIPIRTLESSFSKLALVLLNTKEVWEPLKQQRVTF